MDRLARLPAEERRLYFEQAATRWGRLTPQLMEKDFWVCWTLRRVFGLEEIGAHVTFKGGTSLSKVYKAINRFSEDIDLSIERDYLGFGGDEEPEYGQSGKDVQRRVVALQRACQQVVAEQFIPQLHRDIGEELQTETGWSITPDTNDPDSQTVLFHYPPGVKGMLSEYFAPSVKLEIGARSDHFPVEQATVQPYLCEALPNVLDPAETPVRVLAGERTFWEKATILHATAHQPKEKKLALRLSRHYYDLHQLANHPVGERAMSRLDLLARVAEHKSVFFKSAWARYDLARSGTLRLIPDQERLQELKADFVKMQTMFFGEFPDFDNIMGRLQELERTINA